MGVFRVPLEIGNPLNQFTETVEALVDTGAIYSMAPSSLLSGLGIEPIETITFNVADGRTVDYPTAWAAFRAAGRRGMARVIFGPENRYLLGATTLEDLRLIPDPINQRLVPGETPLL
jgi:predicted aspartyl protease